MPSASLTWPASRPPHRPHLVRSTPQDESFFGFPLRRWSSRVLALEPVGRAAGAINRALALRHDAFESHLAGMGKHGGPVALDVLIERMPGRALATIDASVALRTSSGSRRRPLRPSRHQGRAIARPQHPHADHRAAPRLVQPWYRCAGMHQPSL